ncbi:MAG TPA: hypothetical protein VGN20_06805 [Mucilaginibacter sp.]|jgi:hypothetical protein
MKNLIYSSALLCFILFVTSCTKSDLVQPGTSVIPRGPGCDSVKTVSFTLTNSAEDSSYEIAFSGQQNYTFSFPASGTKTVSVKPGTYAIYVYSPGNYSLHNFYWNNQQVINQAGARWEGVTITPCSIPQSVRIDQ